MGNWYICRSAFGPYYTNFINIYPAFYLSSVIDTAFRIYASSNPNYSNYPISYWRFFYFYISAVGFTGSIFVILVIYILLFINFAHIYLRKETTVQNN